jgi:hypothetical protein
VKRERLGFAAPRSGSVRDCFRELSGSFLLQRLGTSASAATLRRRGRRTRGLTAEHSVTESDDLLHGRNLVLGDSDVLAAFERAGSVNFRTRVCLALFAAHNRRHPAGERVRDAVSLFEPCAEQRER